ncbi:hypothetical protein ACNRWW_19695 [Metabacillus sp. HB246100]
MPIKASLSVKRLLLYPEHPEMHYMSFKTAIKIVDVYTDHKRVVPIDEMKQILQKDQTKIQQFQGEIKRIELFQSRLERAEGFLKNYEHHLAAAKKIESNPLLKGKTLVSKTAKKEYGQVVSKRDHYKTLLNDEGVSN